MYRIILAIVCMLMFTTVAVAGEPAKRLRVKAKGGETFHTVQLEAAVKWAQVRAAQEPVKVGTVSLSEHGTVDILCKGKDKGLVCQGKLPAGTVLHMESEFTDE